MCEIVHVKSESEGRPEKTFQLCCRLEITCPHKFPVVFACYVCLKTGVIIGFVKVGHNKRGHNSYRGVNQ